MIKNKIILLILLFCAVVCCQTRKEAKKMDEKTEDSIIDSTFHFTIKNATDFIDSRTGTLTRLYVHEKRIVHFGFFKKEELQKIEKLYFKLGLDSLPTIYEPDCIVKSFPHFEDRFTVFFKNKQKQFIYSDNYKCTEKQTEDIIFNIEEFRNFVYSILYNKQGLKYLENSDIEFM